MADCYNKLYLKDKKIEVNCGKCLNCIENSKKEKALRIVHEMNDFKFKYFVTLTMDEIQATRSKSGLTEVRRKDLTAYIKHLQYYAKRYSNSEKAEKIRYISCGEYGAKTNRAHYHLVILCNTLLISEIKRSWRKGHVQAEAIKDARAVYYTAGYTDKKVQKYYKNHYENDYDDREVAFIKSSKGNGKDYIEKKIAQKEITPERYFIESFNGKNKLPIYYKYKYKCAVMGVIPRYKRFTEKQIKYFKDKNIKINRKTYMENQEDYDNNKWKWEIITNKLKEINLKRDPIYYKYEEMKKVYGDNWKDKVYNLMFNEEYDELNEYEKEFTNLMKRQRELLKIKAEQKYWKKINSRIAI